MSTTITSWKSRVESRTQIARDIIELRLEKPANFTYEAGQFVQFRIPHDDGVVLRSYSLASHPADSHLLFCIKLLPDGVFSGYAASMLPGFELEWQGPRGRFVHAGPSVPLLFVATGAGLAPIYGLIRDELLNKKNTERIELLFGVRSEEDIFWMSELETLQNQCKNFTYSISLSRPGSTWAGKQGRVTAHLPLDCCNVRAYVCGSAEMVKEVRALLLARNLAPEAVHFEIF